MMLALMLALIAQTPAAMPRIDDLDERRAFHEAQRTLEADAGLLGLHRGFRAYLATDEDLRQAEESYNALMELPRLRERVEDFEEALIVDVEARGDFDRYMARMRRDPGLLEAVEGLGAVEMEWRSGAPGLPGAFAYLRANPQRALPFLAQRETQRAALEALRPLRDAMHRDAHLRTALREAWMRVDALAGAREAVYPWWARAYSGDTAAAKRYLALDTEFASFPSQRRAWESREMAWASRPEAVAWRDHLYARMRRDPALGSSYFGYLHTLRMRPDAEKYADEAFADRHGAAPAWPPPGTPARLAAWTRPESVTRPVKPGNPVTPSLNGPILDRPGRPNINRPATPKKPVTPQRAVEPSTLTLPQ